ncbi:MAG: hypothetical protein ACE5H9_07435 [Anaerolineae bacterium]
MPNDEILPFVDLPPPEESKPARKARFSLVQLLILLGLGGAVACVCVAFAGVLLAGWGNLSDDTNPPSAAAFAQVATATPTLVPQTPTPTSLPTPTATYAVPPEFINKDKIAEIKTFVERWRELSPSEDVPIIFLTRDQVREQWQTDSVDQGALEAIERQREFYLAMNLIEPYVDLAQAVFDSSTDIILGYYTPDEKVMYVIAESVNMFAQEDMTFAHEYVHALQDHNFDIGHIFTDDNSADALIAARSLPEGDARLLESLYTSQEIDPTQIEYTIYRYLMAEHPELEGVSPALGILTYFPYTAGEYFVIYLYIEGGFSWELVNQAYQQLPVSSEQVMHPEKYLVNERPVPVSLPDLGPVLGEAWRELDRDVLGEIGLLVWLIDQVDDQTAFEGAAGWGGDEYTLWVDDADHRLLVDRSTWDSPAEAVEFFEAFNAYMSLRIAGEEYTFEEETSARLWQGATGVTLLARQDREVLIVVAPDRGILDSVRGQFAGF